MGDDLSIGWFTSFEEIMNVIYFEDERENKIVYRVSVYDVKTFRDSYDYNTFSEAAKIRR